jgi:hypothetical protein
MRSYTTGSKSPHNITRKSTAPTIPYFILFLKTDQRVSCRILDIRARLVLLNVTVNIELSRGVSKILYKDNNTVPSGVFDFNCFAIKFNVHFPYNYTAYIQFNNLFHNVFLLLIKAPTYFGPSSCPSSWSFYVF